jgi:hypothetical protein
MEFIIADLRGSVGVSRPAAADNDLVPLTFSLGARGAHPNARYRNAPVPDCRTPPGRWLSLGPVASEFTATDLGILPGFSVSQATAISSSGIVVGYSSNSGFQFYGSEANGSSQGWIYSNGVLTPLESNGQNATIPLGVNASGQIVGLTGPAVPGNPGPSTMFSSFFYQNGKYNPPAGFPQFAVPAAINDAFQIPLWLNPAEENQSVALWNGGSQTALPVAHGATTSFAFRISGNGQVAGGSAIGTQQGHQDLPEVWSNGVLKTFTVPPGVTQAFAGLPGMELNAPTSINNSGWIVGYSTGVVLAEFGSNSFLAYLPGFLVPAPQVAISSTPTPLTMRARSLAPDFITVSRLDSCLLLKPVPPSAAW